MASSPAKDTRSTIIPALRYRDAHRAIDWLITAFGFARQAVFDGPDGRVAHAQLTFGNGMIMLGSVASDSPYPGSIVEPGEIGNRATSTICLIVADAAAVYASAKAAGAVMVSELAQMDYGGRAFSCQDPEGHLWSIGEYDPWADV